MPKKRRQEPLEESMYEPPNTSQTSTVIKPCPFFGNLDEDFDSWIKNFDRIAKANGWSKEKKTITIPAFLRDRAAEHYESLEEEVKDDYNLLCESLRERFIPKELQTLYYSNLFGCQQSDQQSVEDYASEITKLTSRAYVEMPRKQKEILTKEHFVQGLKPDLKRFVLMSNPKTFEEAFRHAKREECHDVLTRPQARAMAAACEEDRTARFEKSVENLTVQLSAMATNLDRITSPTYLNRGNRNQSNRGYRRGRGRGTHNNAQRRSDRNLRTTDGRPICNFCMKVGHIEFACREKKTGN